MTTTAAAYAANLLQFKREAAQAIAAAKNYGRTKMTADLTLITGGLGTDTTTHPKVMATPPAGVSLDPIYAPGGTPQSYFINRVQLAVNKGKAANLTNADMETALNTALAAVVKPVNTAIPQVTGIGTIGENLSATTGMWTGMPTSYAYAWQRAGVPISGATLPQYALVGADSGNAIGCIVTATNSAGSTAAPISNTIVCA